ncbi:MAG: hypothetical protein NC124_02260 [Clostridium sp.]|nr:hypothetical protein [Clostridium sp.]
MNLTTHERTSYYNNLMMCCVDGKNIFQTDYLGNRIGNLGVSAQAYLELKGICDQYYNKLVELGAIPKEKTPEEIAKEQTEMMGAMMQQLKSLQEEISIMKDNNNVRHPKVTSNSEPDILPDRTIPVETRTGCPKGSSSNGKK